MAKRNETSKNEVVAVKDGDAIDEQPPTVTVILPFKDDVEYIQTMLHQLKEQNYSDFEVICVNDSSVDGSAEIVDEFVFGDPRFKVMKNKGEGTSEARNTGIAAARGKYIISFDPIDMIGADILEYMVPPLRRNSTIDVVLCAMDEYAENTGKFRAADWIVDTEAIPENVPFKASSIENFYNAICGYPGNKMIRKSLYDKYDLKWQDLPMHDDMSLTQAALSLANKVYFENRKLYHKRVLSDLWLRTQYARNTYFTAMFQALEQLKKTLKKNKKWKRHEKSFNNYALDQIRWKYYNVDPEARQAVHDALKGEWFEKLGLLNVADEDFTSKEDLEWMKAVIASPVPIEKPVEG